MKEVNKNRKDEILSHHTEVNIDEIWAAIEPQVDIINAEKKRKKRFLIFFLFGVILLASSGLYMWQSGSFTETVISTSETDMEQRKGVEEEKLEKISNNKSTTQSPNNQNNKNKIKLSKEEKTLTKSAASTPIATNKSVNTFNKTRTKEAILTTNYTSKSTTIISLDNEILSPQINTNKATSSDEKIVLSESDFPKENIKGNPPKQIAPSPQISIRDTKFPDFIPDVGDVNIAKKEKENEDSEDKLPGGKLSFALSANTGISFINRGLGSNIDGESSPEVLRLRRQSETLLEAIHYGLRGKLTHKSGFSFSTGAQYTVLSERYDNNNLEVASDSIEGIVKRVVQLNGDTVDIIGMLPRTTTYDYEKEIYNRYKMIDVPFIVGFEGGMEKWSLGIQAGIFVNLALKTSGQVRNSTTEDLNIGTNQSDIFKSKVGLSYYGGIYIRRALSPNLDITIAPHGRFFAQDFNVDSYELKQRYSLIGVQAGLSYRFGY